MSRRSVIVAAIVMASWSGCQASEPGGGAAPATDDRAGDYCDTVRSLNGLSDLAPVDFAADSSMSRQEIEEGADDAAAELRSQIDRGLELHRELEQRAPGDLSGDAALVARDAERLYGPARERADDPLAVMSVMLGFRPGPGTAGAVAKLDADAKTRCGVGLSVPWATGEAPVPPPTRSRPPAPPTPPAPPAPPAPRGGAPEDGG